MDATGELRVLLVGMRQAEIRAEVARDRLARMARQGREGWRTRPPGKNAWRSLGATIGEAVVDAWRCGGAVLSRAVRPGG